MEKALTLKEVAELLDLSYSTVFDKRYQIGFRLPGSRIWRVWPADLGKLRPQVPEPRPLISAGDRTTIPSPTVKATRREAGKELDRLLAMRPPKRRR